MDEGDNGKLGWVLYGNAASFSAAAKGNHGKTVPMKISRVPTAPLVHELSANKSYCIPRNPSSVGSLRMSIHPP